MKDMDDPTNRDSVPAMLTPGEYVLNKEASQMFGPMIEKMNQQGLAQRHAGNQEVPHLNTGGLFDGGQWDTYANTIGKIESSDRYDIMGGANNHYVGRYQLGDAAIKDAAKALGLKKPPSKAELRKNPALQDKLFKAYTQANHGYLKQKIPGFEQLDPQKQQQILGYAHNQGAGGAAKWYRGEGDTADAFGTKGSKYSNALAAAQGGEGVGPVPQQQAAPPPPQQTQAQEASPSFGDAFSAARAEQGDGGQFAWNGNTYNTNLAANMGGQIPPIPGAQCRWMAEEPLLS